MADKNQNEQYTKFRIEVIDKYNTREKVDNYINELKKDTMGNMMKLGIIGSLVDFNFLIIYDEYFGGYSPNSRKEPKPIAEFNKLDINSKECIKIMKSEIWGKLLKDCNSAPDWRTEEQKKFWAKG